MCNRKSDTEDCDELLKLFIMFNQSKKEGATDGIDAIIATVLWLLDNEWKSSLLAQCLMEIHLQDGKIKILKLNTVLRISLCSMLYFEFLYCQLVAI